MVLLRLTFSYNDASKPQTSIPANEHERMCACHVRENISPSTHRLNSRLCLHEGHACGLIAVGVKGWDHFATDWVEDR